MNMVSRKSKPHLGGARESVKEWRLGRSYSLKTDVVDGWLIYLPECQQNGDAKSLDNGLSSSELLLVHLSALRGGLTMTGHCF